MYHSLRPELRGAHRVLRSLQNPRSSCSHRVVRSFSSYSRLQVRSRPSNTGDQDKSVGASSSTSKPSEAGQFALPRDVNGFIKDFYESFARNKSNQTPENPQTAEQPDLEIKWSEVVKGSDQDVKDVDQYLQHGQVPLGYRVVEKIEDVPTHLQHLNTPNQTLQLPFLYTDDPSKLAHWSPIYRNAPQTQATGKAQQSAEVALEGSSEGDSSLSGDVDRSQSSKHHGSWHKRRKRARENRAASTRHGNVPEWFYNNNVWLSQPDHAQEPRVLPVTQLSDGTYEHVTSSLSQAEVQVQPPQPATEQEPEPKRQVWGKGRNGPSDEGGSDQPPSPSVPTTTITNTKSLSAGRYFIESAQYEELLNTFRGRLRSPTESQRDWSSPVAMNHLTILHGAPNAELLLDAVVLDLCTEVGADCVHLDAQDIGELIAGADVDDAVAAKASKLSFKLYKNLYEPDIYQDSLMPRQDEEENEDEDEEDPESIGPQGIGVPVGSFIAPMNLDEPFNLKNIFNQLSGGQKSNSPRFGLSIANVDADGMYTPIVNSVLSSSIQAQKIKRAQLEQDKESHENKTEPPSASSRPLVVHLQNYRLLQGHQLTQGFMAELLRCADLRRAQGQPIVVVGTDSLRNDYQRTSHPRSILDVQENRSHGVSTAVILTPVFPHRDAEIALSYEDRQTRIRNINARHLHQVLKSRGTLLHGLEDGFWNRDYQKEMGDGDYEVLSQQFWPFVQVQRLAALIAGAQTPKPILYATVVIADSDNSKVAWARRNQPDLAMRELREAEQKSPEHKLLRSVRSKASRHEKKLLSGVIEPNKISTTFKDIHIPSETVEALKMLTTLSLQRPEAFRYGVLKSDRIPGLLLYGPPGTGKTLAAKAVAKESGATMLEVSAADLNDMYVGEGEKNVQALFSLAKKLSPCVVFLDEADAMFSARHQGRRASHRELLNQFLKEWDGMSNDSGSAFLMVATNRPMDLDDAVLRRLPRRILVDLPTEQDRLKILQIHLRNEQLDDSVNLPDLAKRTPFYSGSDLKNVAVAAALNAVREENEAAAAFRLSAPTDPPKSTDEEESLETASSRRRRREEAQYKYPEKRTLTKQHFDKALEEIAASISEDMSSLRDIRRFDEQYGDRKGKRKKGPKWGFKSANEPERGDTVKVRT